MALRLALQPSSSPPTGPICHGPLAAVAGLQCRASRNDRTAMPHCKGITPSLDLSYPPHDPSPTTADSAVRSRLHP